MTVESNIAEVDPMRGLFEPETLLPGQYFGARVGQNGRPPAQRLMVAVLEEALSTFHRHVGSGAPRSRRLVSDVEAWLTATTADGPFSFGTICAALDLDEDYLRRGIERWAAAERHRAATGARPRYWNPFRKVASPGCRLTVGRAALGKIA